MTTSRHPLQIHVLARPGYALRLGLRRGRAGNPPLVIFNGLGANLELLDGFVAALDERPLVVIDAPIVEAALPFPPYRFSNLVREVDTVLIELGFAEPIDVMGISWGGFVAQQFALQYPNRCRRLVLAASSPGVLMVPGRPTALIAMLGLGMLPGSLGRGFMSARVLGGVFLREPARVTEHLGRLAPSGTWTQIAQLLALWGWSSLPWLSHLRQPTLVLAGSEDPVAPLANAYLLANLIPDATLTVLEDGHGFLLARPLQTATCTLGFLTRP